MFLNQFYCITTVCRVDYDLHLQKLPLPSVEGPRTAERSHEGTRAVIGSHSLCHRLSANPRLELSRILTEVDQLQSLLGGRGVNVRDWRQSKTESGTSSTN